MAGKQFEVTRTDAEWRRLLTPEQYDVLRGHGTEAPGSCALNYEKRAGTFACAGCGQPLFVSKRKFESGTGWPSFNDPVAGAVETSTDSNYGMVRTEVHCSRCGSHLGHVFDDGPPPTHLRYCINGVAMNFQPERRALGPGSSSHFRIGKTLLQSASRQCDEAWSRLIAPDRSTPPSAG
jgi:peptide-methionine (R)-S-oxide reductase